MLAEMRAGAESVNKRDGVKSSKLIEPKRSAAERRDLLLSLSLYLSLSLSFSFFLFLLSKQRNKTKDCPVSLVGVVLLLE